MFDVLIAGGDVYDGSGDGPVRADVGVRDDRVAAVGRGLPREAKAVIDAAGKAVCPGFINILSHSHLSILHDPRSLGELTQGGQRSARRCPPPPAGAMWGKRRTC